MLSTLPTDIPERNRTFRDAREERTRGGYVGFRGIVGQHARERRERRHYHLSIFNEESRSSVMFTTQNIAPRTDVDSYLCV